MCTRSRSWAGTSPRGHHLREEKGARKRRHCVKGDFFFFLEKVSDALLRVQSSDKVTSISLPAAPTYHLIEFELEVLSLPSAPAAGGESTLLGVTEPHGKHKDSQKTGYCMATTDHKVRRGWSCAAYGGQLLPVLLDLKTAHLK